MRLATYNVEWFNALFDDDGRLLEDAAPSARHGVTRADQLAALGIVFAALDADAVLVVEAPDESRRRSTVRALETFARVCGLRARRAVIGFPSDTEQEIALLYDPDAILPQHDPQGAPTGKKGSAEAPRFDGVFRVDLDGDGAEETVTFARPPLELAVQTAAGGHFRLIGVHAKSRAPHGARSPEEAFQIGLESRRKQIAQCTWLRQRVERHLSAGDSLIVLGDLNDGPALAPHDPPFDRSGVEIVMGLDALPPLRLEDPHARTALRRPLGALPSTARFWIAPEQRYFGALLDYILVSRDLLRLGPRWRIWHPFDDPACWAVPELRDALLAASDHFPVTMDLPL